ncbi:MAG: hypothetical protein J7L61_01905, partial [Thermoplasmata archaeon]|nr:hypothetical protein [Thermoplasmata archaeon]
MTNNFVEYKNMDGGYRPIEIDLGRNITDEEKKAIHELESIFPHDDLFFEIKNQSLILYLNSIDLKLFHQKVKILTKRYNLKPEDNIFDELLKNVEKIKSYGLM